MTQLFYLAKGIAVYLLLGLRPAFDGHASFHERCGL